METVFPYNCSLAGPAPFGKQDVTYTMKSVPAIAALKPAAVFRLATSSTLGYMARTLEAVVVAAI